MNKKEVIEIMIELWRNVDQAGFDQEIVEAFKNSSTCWQIDFIRDMLKSGVDSSRTYCLSNENKEYLKEIIIKAQKLTKTDLDEEILGTEFLYLSE